MSTTGHRTLSLIAVSFLVACSPADVPNESTVSDEVPGSTRLSGLLGSGDKERFALALEPRPLDFPADHGPHREFRNEWWYVTGNLDAASGERFGFELTLFRFSMSPDALAHDSDWRTDQIYIGHFAISDAATETFHVAQRYSRGALGLAGAVARPFNVWLEDWRMQSAGNANDSGMPWTLEAADGGVSLKLTLDSRKPPVLNGDRGLSQKSSEPGNASYYYSLTRLDTTGVIEIDGRRYDVSGSSWLDREWSSSALAADQSGWDWFALQFDDGTELMFYQLRRIDGSRDPMSAGTFVDTDGTSRHLTTDDVRLDVLDYWESPLGGRYPIRWRIRIPSKSLDVTVTPAFEAQELSTTVRYWEGMVDIDGTVNDRRTGGRGYVEMTGYADPDG